MYNNAVATVRYIFSKQEVATDIKKLMWLFDCKLPDFLDVYMP